MKNIIRKLRGQQELTQEQLAKQIGISRPFLSDIENSKVIPNGRTIIKFANYFGLPVEQIFFEESVMREEHKAI